MDWLTRLNRSIGVIPSGAGVDLIFWWHDAALADNQPHRHTYFEVCLVGAYGEGTFTHLGVDHRLGPGVLFVARPGSMHQIRNSGGRNMELSWVCFGWSGDGRSGCEAERLFEKFAGSSSVVARDSEAVAATWRALRCLAGGPNRLGLRVQVSSLVDALVLAIAQAFVGEDAGLGAEPEQGGGNAAVRHALRYIEDNLTRPLSLEEIAAHAGVSPRHLSRLFSQFAGATPARYVLVARLDRASAMLRHTDAPIKEIAVRAGFADVSYMTRCFTRRFGVPPAAYRRGSYGGIIQNKDTLV